MGNMRPGMVNRVPNRNSNFPGRGMRGVGLTRRLARRLRHPWWLADCRPVATPVVVRSCSRSQSASLRSCVAPRSSRSWRRASQSAMSRSRPAASLRGRRTNAGRVEGPGRRGGPLGLRSRHRPRGGRPAASRNQEGELGIDSRTNLRPSRVRGIQTPRLIPSIDFSAARGIPLGGRSFSFRCASPGAGHFRMLFHILVSGKILSMTARRIRSWPGSLDPCQGHA